MKFSDFWFKLRNWEAWHHHAKYIPLTPVWIWYCIRSGTPWFFTPSNPTLTFGGFEGEGKWEMYEQLPPGSYPLSTLISIDQSLESAEQQILAAGIQYPFVAKPDVGMMGLMVRRITNVRELQQYHARIGFAYIAQMLVDYPVEISAFYYRIPGEPHGTISGLLQKRPAHVTGDGKSNLATLINSSPFLHEKKTEMLHKHAAHLDKIIGEGEAFQLSISSNRSQAGILEGINVKADAKLHALLDSWSHHNGNFYYGRYDIKCASLETLKEGKEFSILEFNGAGAGIQHILGSNYSLAKAMGIILHHWRMLSLISRTNRKAGIRYWPFKKGLTHLRIAKMNFKQLKKLDAEFPSF